MIARGDGFYRRPSDFDPAQPDGTPRKLLNSDVMRGLGWTPRIATGERSGHRLAADYRARYPDAA